MKQKIPKVSDADIQRIVKREFPQSEFIEIENILRIYKSENKEGENRVYASILKLSQSNIELLKKYAVNANNDYRDIIAYSEYPNSSEYALDSFLSVLKKKQLINDDWVQYQTWFNKE